MNRAFDCLLEIFAAGANPATATPIATQNLGKPAVVNGDCTADITATINALSPGTYQATVSAVGSGGSARSGAATFTKEARGSATDAGSRRPSHNRKPPTVDNRPRCIATP